MSSWFSFFMGTQTSSMNPIKVSDAEDEGEYSTLTRKAMIKSTRIILSENENSIIWVCGHC